MSSYDKVVKSALCKFNAGKIEDCVRLIKSAALYQYNVNDILTDLRLEELLKKLSSRIEVQEYKPIKNNIILYDHFTIDNRGLTQQYLDALVASGTYNVLLVHDTNFHDKSSNTLKFCKENNVKTVELGNQSYLERELKLRDIIADFRPEKVLYHLYPSSVLPLVVFGAYKNIVKYQINLTDHAFWLGSQCIDYSFEFRRLGCLRSTQLRNIGENQLLLLPYYPWMEKNEFLGFPSQTNGKVVIFAGAALYKIEGGEGLFYKIVKRILDENPECVLLFAGTGDSSHLINFIHENNYEDRLFFIGERRDIYEVFKHSDIYLNTYPMIGGLMSQYAALLGKPILTYKTIEAEDIVCTKMKAHFVYETIDELVDDAKKMILDVDYRIQKGKFFSELTFGQQEFRMSFNQLFTENKSQFIIEDDDLQMNFYSMYINQINEGKLGFHLESMLLRENIFFLGWKMWLNILINPKFTIGIAVRTLEKIFNKLK